MTRRRYVLPRRQIRSPGMALGVALVMAFGVVLETTAAEPLRVAVSILPQRDLVQRLGGARVVVEPLVQPGQDPHTYEPTPRQMARLATSRLYFTIGESFETAMLPRIRSAMPGVRLVDTLAGLPLLAVSPSDEHVHDADDPHHVCTLHGAFDPHVWLNPRLVAQQCDIIAQALAEEDPDGAADYAANLQALKADLEALDERLQARFQDLTGRRFMVMHPSWSYFADAYGLVQVPIEAEGKSPSARQLARLIDEARASGVTRIFIQPQMAPRAARTVADAIGADLVSIDPLAPDLIANLETVAEAIAQGLRP